MVDLENSVPHRRHLYNISTPCQQHTIASSLEFISDNKGEILDWSFVFISDDIDTSSASDISNTSDTSYVRKTSTTNIFNNFMLFSDDMIFFILSKLNLQDLVSLDIAYCNHLHRPRLVGIYKDIHINTLFNFEYIVCDRSWYNINSALTWGAQRKLNVSTLLVKSKNHSISSSSILQHHNINKVLIPSIIYNII